MILSRACLALILGTAALLAAEPDPSAAVVASGAQVYRLRDLDALLAIAKRHAGKDTPDETRLRTAVVTALTAREPLVAALDALPLTGPARDRFVLDLLDYQAEPATSDPLAGGVTPPTDAPVGTIAVSPVIVALPPLSLPRTIEGTRWILSSEFALRFANRAAANAAEDSAAVIRDAIRGYLQSLPPAAFTTPDQAAMKRELGALLATVLPGFAAHDLLIPALDANKG